MADGPIIIDGTYTVRGEKTSPTTSSNLAQLRQDFQSDPNTREQAIVEWGKICDQLVQFHNSPPDPSLRRDLDNMGVAPGWLEPSAQARIDATHSEKQIVDLFALTFPKAGIVNPGKIPVPKSGEAAPVVITALKEIHDLAGLIRFSITGNAHSFSIDRPPVESWPEINDLSKMVRELESDLSSPKTRQWINENIL